jgi:hypothetical protein
MTTDQVFDVFAALPLYTPHIGVHCGAARAGGMRLSHTRIACKVCDATREFVLRGRFGSQANSHERQSANLM